MTEIRSLPEHSNIWQSVNVIPIEVIRNGPICKLLSDPNQKSSNSNYKHTD